MRIPIKPFTTTFGRTVQVKTLLEVIRKIKNKEEYTDIITESLQELPVDEERDVDEAYEVIDYCQDIVNQEELEYYIEHTKHNKDYE
jgi:hypothetical protein